MLPKKVNISLIIVVVVNILILTTGFLLSNGITSNVRQSLINKELIQLDNIKDRISSEFEKFDAVAYSIANSPRIKQYCTNRNNLSQEEVNEAVDRYNFAFNSSVIYVFDTNGVVIASSNRYHPDSFIGKNYNFRDYFKQAMMGRQGVQITMGLTSNVRGYYTCAPVKDYRSRIVGAVAIKADMDSIERKLKIPNILFIDPNGVVFLSSNSSFVFKMVSKNDEKSKQYIKQNNQYRMKSFEGIWDRFPKNEETVEYDGNKYIFLIKNFNQSNWSLATLVDVEKVNSTLALGMLISTIICFIIIALYRVIDNYFKESKKIKQREEELSYLIDFLPDGAFAVNKKKEIIAWNHEYEKLSGVKAEKMIGKKDYEYAIPFYGERRPVLIDFLDKSYESAKHFYPNLVIKENTLVAETEVTLPDGNSAVLWVKAGNVYNANGDVIGAIEVVRDITKIKNYEAEIVCLLEKLTNTNVSLEESVKQKDYLINELNNANDQLTQLNAEKDKFFSVISHDLRSPLSGFLSLSEMIIEERLKLSKQQIVDYVNTLYHSANQLYELLENLLEWSRVQLGNVKCNLRVLNLKEIISDNISLISTKADTKKISIYNMVDSSINVKADSNMLNAIIRNLMSNAVKFTYNDGSIFLRSSIEENGNIILKIQDTGMGIPKVILDNLFVIGSNTSRRGTNDESSSGLGLLLCKEYADRIDADLKVESEVEKGSTFSLEFKPI